MTDIYAPIDARPPHPLCTMLRQLRTAARMSLSDFEARFGIPAVVIGSYERGDRIPPFTKLDTVLRCYGYKLHASPLGQEAVRLPEDIVAELRLIADQIEAHQTAAEEIQALAA